jgi:cytochrome c oxidase subunit II
MRAGAGSDMVKAVESHDQREAERRLQLGFGLLILVLLVATVAAFAVAAQRWWLPPLASVQGRAVDQVIYTLFAVSLPFFVAAQFFIAFPLLRSRARGSGGFTPPPLTRMPGLAAIIAVAVLAVADTAVLADSELHWFRLYSAPPANALQIKVVGRQFIWYFRYAGPGGKLGRASPDLVSPGNPLGLDPTDPAGKDNIVTTNALHLVVGRPVAFHVTSLDVMHSFNIPNFRIKQDAIPGRGATVWTTPDRVGRYQVACAQLCGVGHYTMRADVIVESQAAFDAWLRSQEQP